MKNPIFSIAMNRLGIFLFFIFLLLASCSNNHSFMSDYPVDYPNDYPKNVSQSTIKENHPDAVVNVSLPDGYERFAIEPGSFAQFLEEFKLKDSNIVYLYDGRKKSNQNAQYAVLDLDVGTKDLQQCADAVMRLRAEYLYQLQRYDDIHFKFTNGDNAEYKRFAEGYRASVDGNKVNWIKKAQKDYSYATFRNYMELVFNYAGSQSLSSELQPITDIHDIQIGDVFIKGGFPGHAVIVMDVAQNKTTGKKIFLLAQSYMPAQDMHILKNPMNADLSPWYDEDFELLKTPEWTFQRDQLKRFASE